MKKINLMAALLLVLTSAGLAASSSYYAKTTVYFNVPTDASFAIAFPDDYTAWNDITGEDEGGATDLTSSDWISFNFTSGTENWVEPDHLGESANGQDTMAKPIMYIDNTGNTDEKFELYWATDLPTNMEVCANSSCTGTCSSPGDVAACTEIGVSEGSETTFATLIKTDEYLNITMYANATGADSGETSEVLYIHSSAV